MFKNPVVRWVCVVLPLLQGALEFYMLSPGWGIVFLGLSVAAFWVLIVTWTGNAPPP
jgi:TM2 domain-containing membrane protein YozV